MVQQVYLDYAATTPTDPQVVGVLNRFLGQDGAFGNPSSTTHGFGREASQAIEIARDQVAALLKADPLEIIWTSGATEANNLALQGAMGANFRRGNHLITCKTEHKSILDVCRWLERRGCKVSYLVPDQKGLIDPNQVAATLQTGTVLVSLMHANNETGVVQDLTTIGKITHQHNVLLHVDAAQSAGKLPIDLQNLQVDLLSLSGHKLYGPKGIGALFVRRRPRRVLIQPLLHGGGQEHGLRAGTLPTHQIAAMGLACQIAGEKMAVEYDRIRALRNRLWQGLSKLGCVDLNGHPQYHLPGILNISFSGITAAALLTTCPEIAAATGSACTSANTELSHVLLAMGFDETRARSAVRFSLGRFTTEEEIDYTVTNISRAVKHLRELSPLWT